MLCAFKQTSLLKALTASMVLYFGSLVTVNIYRRPLNTVGFKNACSTSDEMEETANMAHNLKGKYQGGPTTPSVSFGVLQFSIKKQNKTAEY